MDILPVACVVLLATSAAALLVAGRLPRPGPFRSRVFPWVVGALSVTCLALTGVLATRFDPRAALPLAVAGAFLGLAGRRRHTLFVAEQARLLRRLSAGKARKAKR